MSQHLMEVVPTKTTYSSLPMANHMDHSVIRGRIKWTNQKKQIDTGGHTTKDLESFCLITLTHQQQSEQQLGEQLHAEQPPQDEPQPGEPQQQDEQQQDGQQDQHRHQHKHQHKHLPRNQRKLSQHHFQPSSEPKMST